MGLTTRIVTIVSMLSAVAVCIVTAFMLYQVVSSWKHVTDEKLIPEYNGLLAACILSLIASFFQFFVGFCLFFIILCMKSCTTEGDPITKRAVMIPHIFYSVLFLVSFILGIYYRAHGHYIDYPGTRFQLYIYPYKSGEAFVALVATDGICSLVMVVLLHYLL